MDKNQELVSLIWHECSLLKLAWSINNVFVWFANKGRAYESPTEILKSSLLPLRKLARSRLAGGGTDWPLRAKKVRFAEPRKLFSSLDGVFWHKTKQITVVKIITFLFLLWAAEWVEPLSHPHTFLSFAHTHTLSLSLTHSHSHTLFRVHGENCDKLFVLTHSFSNHDVLLQDFNWKVGRSILGTQRKTFIWHRCCFFGHWPVNPHVRY